MGPAWSQRRMGAATDSCLRDCGGSARWARLIHGEEDGGSAVHSRLRWIPAVFPGCATRRPRSRRHWIRVGERSSKDARTIAIFGVSITPANIVSGRYAYDRYLLTYVRQPIESLLKEYLTMVLPTEGQNAIAAASPNYLPIDRAEITQELSKLR